MRIKKQFLIFVLGATGAGKTTFLEKIQEHLPNDVHLVQVGKRLRAKYQAAQFQGQGNPPNMAAEALQMLFEGIKNGEDQGKRFILVDGQPRDVDQAQALREWREVPHRVRVVIELICPREERWRRLVKLHGGGTPALELARQRMDRDVLEIHETLIRFNGPEHTRFDTSLEHYSPIGAFQRLMLDYRQIINVPGSEFV